MKFSQIFFYYYEILIYCYKILFIILQWISRSLNFQYGLFFKKTFFMHLLVLISFGKYYIRNITYVIIIIFSKYFGAVWMVIDWSRSWENLNKIPLY